MRLILETIKSLFRKLEKIITSNSNRISTVNNTAKTALNNANNAQDTADTALSIAEQGLRYYSINAGAHPYKTSQLNVGESTTLSEYNTEFANCIKNYKQGDIIEARYSYYELNGSSVSTHIRLTHSGTGLIGIDWQIVDDVAQCYEVQIGCDRLNSYIRRFV